MAKTVLIDTGPIVAAVQKRDQHHSWAKAHFQAITQPLLTCDAVISESFFLLKRDPRGKEALCGLLQRGIILSAYAFHANAVETLQLMRKYRDLPTSFADSCLVRMAEINRNSKVFTTDRHFEVYRKNDRQVIPVMMPG